MVEELKDILSLIDAAHIEIFGDAYSCGVYMCDIRFLEDDEEFALISENDHVNLNNSAVESWEWSGDNLAIKVTFGFVNFDSIIFKKTLDKIGKK